MKKILFLSALDFKDKSIQVIRKTPEAYSKAGWQVDYVVARDNLVNGNYVYEDEINPEGINVLRIYWPFPRLRNRLGRHFGLLLNKFSSILVVIKIFLKANSLVKKNNYDVIYGYEMQGVLAMNIVKKFTPKTTKLVSRFQGTFLNAMLLNKEYARLFFNLDLILAIRLDSDLVIMTNDGTQGDQAVKKIKSKKKYNMVFWPNGVDMFPHEVRSPFEKKSGEIVFMSVSRLVGWKRVDRNIYILKALKEIGFSNFRYYVIGEGGQRPYLEKLVKSLGLDRAVFFVGPLKHKDVISYLLNTDYFLSMYDSSNVGNPLLEAIRANKVVVTLANGDTGTWIHHKYNGLIYDPLNINYAEIARDIHELIRNEDFRYGIIDKVMKTEGEKLCTWEQRLNKEVEAVSEL